jgi:hypothetical protein
LRGGVGGAVVPQVFGDAPGGVRFIEGPFVEGSVVEGPVVEGSPGFAVLGAGCDGVARGFDQRDGLVDLRAYRSSSEGTGGCSRAS